MYLRDLFNVLPKFLDANIPIEIGSPPGVGKSESIDQIADLMTARDQFEWGLAKCFIATMSPVDINGYLVPGYAEILVDGVLQRQRVSEFTLPPWMISVHGKPMNSYKRGIVVFEEWDKGDPDTKKASAEPILNGRAGRHALHPGIARIMLVNRTQDRSGTTKNFDFIINRRFEVGVSGELQGWNSWAVKQGVDPMFIAFADTHPEIVFSNTIPETQMPFCTPRSFVRLSKVLPAFVDNKGRIEHSAITTEVANGGIGVAAGTKMMQWILMRNECPMFEDVVADPDNCPVPPRPDAKLMVCYELAHKVDKKTMSKVVKYVQRFTPEFAVTFGKAATRRDYDLINTPSLAAWVAKNASLLNAIGQAR
jgi:hypothetical protein